MRSVAPLSCLIATDEREVHPSTPAKLTTPGLRSLEAEEGASSGRVQSLKQAFNPSEQPLLLVFTVSWIVRTLNLRLETG